ncbi:hypothetical protein DMENIID0001_129580 [Sergentomyia squamirostris]
MVDTEKRRVPGHKIIFTTCSWKFYKAQRFNMKNLMRICSRFRRKILDIIVRQKITSLAIDDLLNGLVDLVFRMTWKDF